MNAIGLLNRPRQPPKPRRKSPARAEGPQNGQRRAAEATCCAREEQGDQEDHPGEEATQGGNAAKSAKEGWRRRFSAALFAMRDYRLAFRAHQSDELLCMEQPMATTKKAKRTEQAILKQLRSLAEELKLTDRRTAVQILCALQDAEDRRNGKD